MLERRHTNIHIHTPIQKDRCDEPSRNSWILKEQSILHCQAGKGADDIDDDDDDDGDDDDDDDVDNHYHHDRSIRWQRQQTHRG